MLHNHIRLNTICSDSGPRVTSCLLNISTGVLKLVEVSHSVILKHHFGLTAKDLTSSSLTIVSFYPRPPRITQCVRGGFQFNTIIVTPISKLFSTKLYIAEFHFQILMLLPGPRCSHAVYLLLHYTVFTFWSGPV